MLDSRSEMVALLVESVPAAPLTLTEMASHLIRWPCQIRSDAGTRRLPPSNVLPFRPREARHALQGRGEDRAAS